MEPVTEYIDNPLLDEEVNEALKRNDPAMIWGMVGTLASMDTGDWALNRAAIKKRFGNNINVGLLDKAVKEKKEPEAESASRPNRPIEDWEKLLHRSEQGGLKPVLINVDLALRNHPDWNGVLAYDEFKQKIRVVKQPPIGGNCPRDWSDEDDTKAAIWMQDKGIYVGSDLVSRSVKSISSENKVHAVREYLSGLTWDGERRLDSWLSDFLGVEKSEYSMSVGRMWMISAVARIMKPGCQADYMLVLEGAQGIKKSSALQVLAGQDWFCDQLPDLHNKDSQIQLFGSWIVEWAELDAMRRAEITSVKSFITRRVEKLRIPHEKYTIEVPRQCVFAGTTNDRNWLKDETGGRRFWPVWCESVDIDGIKSVRDQLWAEAMALFTDGERWWPEGATSNQRISEQQDARMDADPWQERISTYVKTEIFPKNEVSIGDVLSKCMGIPLVGQNHAEKIRVGRVLKSIGWKYLKERRGAGFFNGYVGPEYVSPEQEEA